jgi:hypothetical protein
MDRVCLWGVEGPVFRDLLLGVEIAGPMLPSLSKLDGMILSIFIFDQELALVAAWESVACGCVLSTVSTT